MSFSFNFLYFSWCICTEIEYFLEFLSNVSYILILKSVRILSESTSSCVQFTLLHMSLTPMRTTKSVHFTILLFHSSSTCHSSMLPRSILIHQYQTIFRGWLWATLLPRLDRTKPAFMEQHAYWDQSRAPCTTIKFFCFVYPNKIIVQSLVSERFKFTAPLRFYRVQQ